MTWNCSFTGTVQKFTGSGGWVYVAIPAKCTGALKRRRRSWGMHPVTAQVGNTSWKTTIMTMKGGNFFVALKAAVRSREGIVVGDRITVSLRLE